jgi:hypothetical protein
MEAGENEAISGVRDGVCHGRLDSLTSKFRALRHPRQTVRTEDAETIWTFDIIAFKAWTIANWPTSELRDKDLKPRVACFGRESKKCNQKANLGVLDATDLGIDTRGICTTTRITLSMSGMAPFRKQNT